MEKMPKPVSEEEPKEEAEEEAVSEAEAHLRGRTPDYEYVDESYSEEEENDPDLRDLLRLHGVEVCRNLDRAMKSILPPGMNGGIALAFDSWTKRRPNLDSNTLDAAISRLCGLMGHVDDPYPDPEIDVIARTNRGGAFGGRWPDKPDAELGNGEIIIDTLASKCEPSTIGRLVTESRTVPDTEFGRFEQMRKDAFVIEHVIIGNRSFIHDQAPEAYRLISAMVEYYDAKDDPVQLEEKKAKLEKTLEELKAAHSQGYKDKEHLQKMLDLEAYDGMGNVGFKDADEKDMPVIDYLRRLKKNMEPAPLEAPKTKIPELNAAFERLGKIQVNERTGEVMISLEDLKDIMQILNRHLVEIQGQRKMYPSLIRAIMFVDRLAMMAVRRMDKKDWREAAYDPIFKEIVRFQQLTMSGRYSEGEFEDFYDGFRTKVGEAYGAEDGSVDEDKIIEAYHMLSRHTAENAGEVAKEFPEESGLGYLKKAVWSGNLTHELIGLAEKYVDIGEQ